jgi:glycosyltransferase involved in cell wall biosynthesis
MARLVDRLGTAAEHWLMAADGRLEGINALGLAGRVHAIPERLAIGGGIAPGNVALVRRLLSAIRPHVLLTYNFGAIEAALAHRLWPACRNLHFEDGFGPEETDGRQLARRVWLRRFALFGSATIVVPSRTLEQMARSRWRFPGNQVVYLPNGINVGRFAPALCDRPSAGVTIGTVCALRPEKNLARLLRAVADLPPQLVNRIVIAGDGPERAHLMATADRLGLTSKVDFVGHVVGPEAVLRTLDLFALTSDTEQMPLGLLEAMATGLPVVATDVGDVRIMLPAPQHPFVIAREDEGALTRGLAALAGDRDLARRLGTANRAHACAHFDEDVMVRSFARLIGVSEPAFATRLPSAA